MRVYTGMNAGRSNNDSKFTTVFALLEQYAQQSVAPLLSDPRRFKLESLEVGSGAERR
jgi:hypothetical protein